MHSSAAIHAFASMLLSFILGSKAGLAPNLAGLELLMRGLDVVEFSPDAFQNRVLLREGGGCLDAGEMWKLPQNAADVSSWVLLFCKAGDANCTQFIPSFEQLYLRTVEPTDNIRFGTFDCSLGEASEALCKEFRVDAYPTVAHFQKGKLVGKWVSGETTALLPWLFKELRETSPQSVARDESPQVITKPIASKHTDHAKRAHQGQSLASPAASTSHLQYLHELVLMEDCIFSRLFSGVFLAAILGKCAWILVTGAESDVSVIY